MYKKRSRCKNVKQDWVWAHSALGSTPGHILGSLGESLPQDKHSAGQALMWLPESSGTRSRLLSSLCLRKQDCVKGFKILKKFSCNDKAWALTGPECAAILDDPRPYGLMAWDFKLQRDLLQSEGSLNFRPLIEVPSRTPGRPAMCSDGYVFS